MDLRKGRSQRYIDGLVIGFLEKWGQSCNEDLFSEILFFGEWINNIIYICCRVWFCSKIRLKERYRFEVKDEE